MLTPNANAKMLDSTPIVSDNRPPASVRARMSRPIASVPNQWPLRKDGAVDKKSQSGRCGSKRINQGPSTQHSDRTARKIRQTRTLDGKDLKNRIRLSYPALSCSQRSNL